MKKKPTVIKQINMKGTESPYKQHHVLLFTVNKDNWPIRKEYLSQVTIIMQNGRLPAKITSPPKSLPSFKHGSYIQ